MSNIWPETVIASPAETVVNLKGQLQGQSPRGITPPWPLASRRRLEKEALFRITSFKESHIFINVIIRDSRAA